MYKRKLSSIADVSAEVPADGDVVSYDSASSTWVSEPPSGTWISLGALTTTSGGTPILWSSIPAGVKHLRLTLLQISTDGANNIRVRFGDEDGIDSTNYGSASCRFTASAVATDSSTTYFDVYRTAAADIYSGIIDFTWSSGHLWVASGNYSDNSGPPAGTTSGYCDLPKELTQVQVSVSADLWDGGAAELWYQQP
tara:strand:+ start:207 stop:794 length:588 start_codon:yes stop_codon:yes gene_type:complete